MTNSRRLGDPVKGEWECDECGHIIMGRSDSPPQGACPNCGESAEESFTFYGYGEDDDYDDDDGSDDYRDDYRDDF